MSEHGDQGIDAKSIDLPSNEITHPGLGHSEQICRSGLCESTSVDQLAELDHQVGAHLEILSFLARETEVAKHVTAGASHLDCHRTSFFCPRRRRKSARRLRAQRDVGISGLGRAFLERMDDVGGSSGESNNGVQPTASGGIMSRRG
jgi:hypothetical protein